jgi:hypothetical protein
MKAQFDKFLEQEKNMTKLTKGMELQNEEVATKKLQCFQKIK